MDFSSLIGRTFIDVVFEHGEKIDDRITFKTEMGEEFSLYHDQDCCESVYVESIVGDLTDLVGTPILLAEEVTSQDQFGDRVCSESFTWTFYKLATINGYVDIRWLGESNGYYSESVTFSQTKKVDVDLWLYNKAIKDYLNDNKPENEYDN